jgi:hypothetical protein
MSDPVGKVKAAGRILAPFFFGTGKEVRERAIEVAKDVHDTVERKRGRPLNAPAASATAPSPASSPREVLDAEFDDLHEGETEPDIFGFLK